jgi:hypothetical protein
MRFALAQKVARGGRIFSFKGLPGTSSRNLHDREINFRVGKTIGVVCERV